MQSQTPPPAEPQHYYRRHVFFCLNERPNGEACCAQHRAKEAFDHCKRRLRAEGLDGAGGIRVNKAGCLDRCTRGPVLVVYPDSVWYSFVDLADLDEIIDAHLIGGKPVARLRLSHQPDEPCR